MRAYRKLIVQIIAGLATGLVSYATDGVISPDDWLQILIVGVAGGLAVERSDNTAMAPYIKAVLSAIMAGLTIAVELLADGGINGLEWVQIASAVLGAVAVYITPNDSFRGKLRRSAL